MQAYRGKYPNRIREVWTNRNSEPRGAFVKTNAGKVLRLVTVAGMRLPKLGTDASDVETVPDYGKGEF